MDNTLLLLHLDNNVIDSSSFANIVIPNGITYSSTIAKFGDSAIFTYGAVSELDFPFSSNFDFGTGDWTIEGWFNFTDFFSNTIYGLQNSGNTTGFFIGLGSAYGGISITAYQNSLSLFSIGADSSSLVLNNWYHLAFVKSGSTFYIFVNGVSQTLTTNIVNSATFPTFTPVTDTIDIGDDQVI